MKIELLPNETLIRKSMATRYSGNRLLWTGQLFLTDRRLKFITHPLNFQRYSIAVPLHDIASVVLKYNLRFFPHGFLVHLKNGKSLHFSVWRRKSWVNSLNTVLE